MDVPTSKWLCNPVLEDCRWVVTQAQLVSINHQKIAEAAEQLNERTVFETEWHDVQYFTGTEDEIVQYVAILDSLNFLAWKKGQDEHWGVEVAGKKYTGWHALVVCINQELIRSKQLLTSNYLANLNSEDFQKIFKGANEWQLSEARLHNLQELGKVLESEFNGSFANLIRFADSDVLRLLALIVDKIPNFKDEAIYKDRKVRFYKRAQILIADVYNQLKGLGAGSLHGIELLTGFADECMPQTLRHLGILEYSDSLSRKVDGREELSSGGIEEVEIRAATVVAIDCLRTALETQGQYLRTFEVDFSVWVFAQGIRDMKPFHRVCSVNY